MLEVDEAEPCYFQDGLSENENGKLYRAKGVGAPAAPNCSKKACAISSDLNELHRCSLQCLMECRRLSCLISGSLKLQTDGQKTRREGFNVSD